MITSEQEYWNERFNEEQRAIQIYYEDVGYAATRPSTVYKTRIFIDGDMWCVLYCDNIQDGVAGFGKSPEKAMNDFDINWKKELTP